MLNRIVHFSLRFRGVILALALLLAGYGFFVGTRAKLDVFPEFVQPQVTIQTESPGLSAEEVEVLVTRPIESALLGTGQLETIRSESIQGLSVVTTLFQEGADIYKVRQLLAEKLGETAGELPVNVKTPTMSPLVSSTMDLLKFGLVSPKLSPMELRTFADWVVRPRLLAVPGVARTSVFGGEVRQLQIQFRPERLAAFGVTLAEVVDGAQNATGVRGAGFIDTPGQRIIVQSEGQSLTPDQLGRAIVAYRGGQPIRLDEIAKVAEAGAPKFGDALIQNQRGVLITVSGQYGANTLEVTRGAEAALEEMKPLFAAQGIKLFPRLHRPATFIENALRNLRSSLAWGALLVVVILFFFLLDWRTALISFSSIPLSLLAAVIVLDHFGASLNAMTLGGLAVAIGVVVDDAIIDVENILRRLRLNQSAAQPRPLLEVVLEASLEVRTAIVYATFIVALVFVPVFTMTGLQGRFFAPLGWAFVLATLASLGVALTVTPALCSKLLARTKPHEEPRYIQLLKGLHRRALHWLAGRAWIGIGLALALFVLAMAALPFLGGEFLPDFKEGHFVLGVSAAPGTSLEEMLRLGQQISTALLQMTQEVATVEQQAGRAEMAEDTWGPHRCEFHVELKPLPAEQEGIVQNKIRRLLEQIPGIRSEVMTFLGDRIGESMSGETAQVVVHVYGEDLDALDRLAQQIARLTQSVPGAVDVQSQVSAGSPRWFVRLRPDRLTQFGFRPVEVLQAVQTAFQGVKVGQVYQGHRVFDVTVVLDPAERKEPEEVGSLLLRNAQGVQLSLRQLADVYSGSGRYSIVHEGASRRQTVTCNVSGRDVASFVSDLKKAIASQVALPSGVYLSYSGAAEAQARAREELLIHSSLVGVGILVLLFLVFGNWPNVVLVLANLPFALVGGVLAAFLGDRVLSLGSLVGFVTVFGISMRNSIMMISHFDHLVTKEGMTWNLETLLRGASERLLPISMTALATGLALLPLVIGSGEAGREIEGPMATVILGGLITSTALNLLVLPVMAFRFGRFKPAGSAES